MKTKESVQKKRGHKEYGNYQRHVEREKAE